MSALVESLNAIVHYVEGNSSRSLKKHMNYYQTRKVALVHDFYEQVHFEDEIIQIQEKLLKKLNIPFEKWGNHLKSKESIYSLLIKLCKEDYLQIHFIVELIEKEKNPDDQKLMLAFGGAFGGSLLLGHRYTFPWITHAMDQFMSIPIAGPIAGLVGALCIMGYELYKKDPKKSITKQDYDTYFLILNTLINSIGYLGWILTATAKPICSISCLLIIALAVNVVKEIIWLYKLEKKYSELVSYEGFNPVIRARDQIRQYLSYTQQRNTSIINLIHASLLMCTMIVWTVLPDQLILNVAITSAVMLIHAMKKLLSDYHQHQARERMQLKLNEVIDEKQLTPMLANNTRPMVSSSKQLFFSSPLPQVMSAQNKMKATATDKGLKFY